MNKQRSNTEPGSDLISRQAEIDAMEQAKEQYFDRTVIIGKMQDIVNNLPSAQPEPLTVTIDYEPSKDECDRLKQAMRDAPIMLLPSEIIRCKDCKHSFLHDNGEKISRICGRTKMCGTTKDDWFCADAERSTE